MAEVAAEVAGAGATRSDRRPVYADDCRNQTETKYASLTRSEGGSQLCPPKTSISV